MTPETIQELLREIPVSNSAEARERMVAAARADIEARRAPGRAPRRLALKVALAAVVLGGALLTPPGRAASGWVGDLVGIGDVGGSPTQKERGFAGQGPAIVINNGYAPDGSRYEWVAYPCKVDLHDEGLPERFEGFGVAFEWPGSAQEGFTGGGSCDESNARRGEHVGGQRHFFDSLGTQIVPSQFKGVAQPDLVVSGTTTPSVQRVAVIYTDASGGQHRLAVDFERIGPKLRDKLTASASLGGTFVAFIPGEWAARDELESRLDLRALQGTGKLEVGPLARRDRRDSRAARLLCAPKQPDLSRAIDPGDIEAQEKAFAPYRKCMDEHMPPSPVQLVAYDQHGHELGRESEPLFIPARPGALPPMPRLTKRPVDPDAVGKPIVLASGRTPDGGRYEFYVERFAESGGKVYGNCVNLWWPNTAAPAGGSCGPGLPPSTAYGRRHPEQVFAKPYGFLQRARPATRYLMLSGFARPSVSSVRVVVERADGSSRDAPVELTRVDRELSERMAADGPFGYFVAFVAKKDGKWPIDVIAYDDSGRELSSFHYRSPVID